MMQLGFTESEPFMKVRDELLGGDEGYRKLQNALMQNPRAGTVIPGANGVRKVRFKKAGSEQGKSGGIRVIYLYIEEQNRIVFYLAYAKNVADDLTPKQKRAIAATAQAEKERGQHE